jgi:release factor glutamine methyltransferase
MSTAIVPHPDGRTDARPSSLPASEKGEFGGILSKASAALKAVGIENPRMEARILLAHALGATAEDVIAERIAPTPAAMIRLETALKRRLAHEPIAYITGKREFWSHPFLVDQSVLIPRPETEILVEEALRRFPDRDAPLSVLDLGIGSGCILLAFLCERPNARGTGIDASAGAISLALRNADALGLGERTSFCVQDWSGVAGRYDAVFSNPPYIKTSDIAGLAPDVAVFEPRVALDGGEDGLDAYRSLALILPKAMKSGARAFIELGAGQEGDVARIFRAQGLCVDALVNDLAQIPRCLVLARQT